MAVNRNPANFFRREEAAKKKKAVKVRAVRYEIVEETDDVIFLDGPYRGRTIRELFPLGPNERDYIVKELWFQNDDRVNQIIASMTYQEV